jgi:hypothetical protein
VYKCKFYSEWELGFGEISGIRKSINYILTKKRKPQALTGGCTVIFSIVQYRKIGDLSLEIRY